MPAFTPDMTPARSAAVQFGGSAVAVAEVPTSIAPAIMPTPIMLRNEHVGSFIEWVAEHGAASATWTDAACLRAAGPAGPSGS